MRYLRAAEVREALPMSECIEAMVHAFGGTRDGQSRTRLGGSLVLLGLLDGQASVKIVSTGPGDEAGIVAVFVVDDRKAAASEAGDLLRVARRPDADLAELLAGRTGPDGQPFTLFKSVGIAAQDAAAAIRALDNAERLGIGVRL